MTPSRPTKPIAVKLTPDVRARLTRLAESRNRTAHWVMREAIQEYIKREEKRDAFRDTCQKAWDDYQTTGRHLTVEEADSWLGQLADGHDVEPPECHT
ncbi:MAG TPA: CopG family transcriptional regulator [Nitrospira sp.]|nr:CopG family transcriptional regulator [Nitrospira sp.]